MSLNTATASRLAQVSICCWSCWLCGHHASTTYRRKPISSMSLYISAFSGPEHTWSTMISAAARFRFTLPASTQQRCGAQRITILQHLHHQRHHTQGLHGARAADVQFLGLGDTNAEMIGQLSALTHQFYSVLHAWSTASYTRHSLTSLQSQKHIHSTCRQDGTAWIMIALC